MNRGIFLSCMFITLITVSMPASAQHLYFSSGPNLCWPPPDYEPCHVYLHSPDDDGFMGATFTLETQHAWSELQSYTPAPGAVIVSVTQAPGTGDQPFTAIVELLWGQRTLVHEPLVTFTFSSSPFGENRIYDATLSRTGGGTEPATGLTSEFLFVDCFYPALMVNRPSPIIIPVGTSTTVNFSWYVDAISTIGGDLTVSDELGWVTSWTPSGVIGSEDCRQCFFENTPGTITVLIPAGTAVGTESVVTFDVSSSISCWNHPVIKADRPVSVNTSTWGRVKAMFD